MKHFESAVPLPYYAAKPQFLDHLADDVLPGLLDRLAASKLRWQNLPHGRNNGWQPQPANLNPYPHAYAVAQTSMKRAFRCP